MKAKGYTLIRTVFVLTLVVLSLVSGPTLMAGNTVSGIGAYASGTHESVYDESTQAGGPTCVTIQRGAFGEVADVYIWAARPDANSNHINLYT